MRKMPQFLKRQLACLGAPSRLRSNPHHRLDKSGFSHLGVENHPDKVKEWT